MNQNIKQSHYCERCQRKVAVKIKLHRRHPNKNGLVLCVYCLECGRTVPRKKLELDQYIQLVNDILKLGLENYKKFKELSELIPEQ